MDEFKAIINEQLPAHLMKFFNTLADEDIEQLADIDKRLIARIYQAGAIFSVEVMNEFESRAMTDIPDNRGGLANSATPKALGHQADNLREKLEQIMLLAKIGYDSGSNWQYDTIQTLEALSQDREQQLLVELLEEKRKYSAPIEYAVPVAVIKQRMVGGLERHSDEK
jgi:hypothetical protein